MGCGATARCPRLHHSRMFGYGSLVTYTVWMHGRRIGETRFELSEHFQRRVGVFQPTPHGLTVLPEITAMFPALLEFAEMCRRHGLDVDDNWCQAISESANAFEDTPEGQRVLEAADRIAQIEVRDPAGRVIAWESLAISELDVLMPMTAKAGMDLGSRMNRLKSDPIRFMMSMTLPADSPDAGAGLFTTVRRRERRSRIRLARQSTRDVADPHEMT